VGNCVCRTTGNRHPYNPNRVASEFVPATPQGAKAPAVVLSGEYAGEEGLAQLSSPISKVWREMARVVTARYRRRTQDAFGLDRRFLSMAARNSSNSTFKPGIFTFANLMKSGSFNNSYVTPL
jgi:hypothetical protein